MSMTLRASVRSRPPTPWDQVTERRALASEHAALEVLVRQLREANQHLVLAAVNAQTLRDEAEAGNRRQTEFLAMLAHELRNPMAPISVAAALLGKTPDASPQLCHLQAVIGRQVGHLSRLLDDLLDAARISSGKITLLKLPVLLSDVLERAIEAAQPGLDARRQRLTIETSATAVTLDADHVRLTQVFSNLLLNASKFTPDHGHISILVTALDGNVNVAVGDDGAGIAAEVLPHIFDLFTQGARSLARSEGGLGIGLSIVRNIVQMHGGTVTASSAGIGKGSRFEVTLPCAACAPDTIGTSGTSGIASTGGSAPAPLAPCRVLLVEDNADASDVLKLMLEMEMHTVSVAGNGVAGLAMARAHAYDVLICDIGMPGMSGIELVRALRASDGARLPLLLGLSGYGQAQDRANAIEAGFDDYFVKPVDVDQLLVAIARHTIERPPAPAA